MSKSKIKWAIVCYLSIGLIFAMIVVVILAKREHKPNVLLVSIDALRPDHLSCYGYQRNTSLNIDILAKEGVRFENTYIQGTWTLPSTISILTSTYPYQHRVESFGDSINPSFTTLPQILRDHGYQAAFFGQSIFKTIGALNNAFDIFDADDVNVDARLPAKKAVEWIRANRSRPFFLWIHFMDTHLPYHAPEPYGASFQKEGIYNDKISNLPVVDLEYGVGGIPKFGVKDNITDGNYYIAQYDGAIKYVDGQIRTLLNELKRLNLDKDTLIVVMADHGEFMGEHDLYFSHANIFEPIVKIPLILRYDHLIPRNKVIDNHVQTLDVAPTILDILKIQKPPYMLGLSLLPLMQGREHYPKEYIFLYGNKGLYAIRSQDWKLIYIDEEKIMSITALNSNFFIKRSIVSVMRHFSKFFQGQEYILFNLGKYNFEKESLISAENGQLQLLKEKLAEFTKDFEQKQAGEGARMPISKEAREKLKSFGYVQ